ncbi:MAG: hypothetical protein WAV41_05085 [Microgenomates group bacterium]
MVVWDISPDNNIGFYLESEADLLVKAARNIGRYDISRGFTKQVDGRTEVILRFDGRDTTKIFEECERLRAEIS